MAFKRLLWSSVDVSGAPGSRCNNKKLSKTAFLQKIKRRAGVWAFLLLLSICIYNVIVFCGLPRLLPLPNISQGIADRSALVKFIDDAIFGVALPLVPSHDLFDQAAVIVGPYGPVRAPYTRKMAMLMRRIVQDIWLDREPKQTSNDFSIIISARNEEKYIVKTLEFLFKNTDYKAIREVIIVDDASTKPVKDLLNADALEARVLDKIKVIRFDKPQGLIRARISGADSALSDNLFFLDAHCKPRAGWEYPLLQHLKTNYRRVACPVIYDVKEHNWDDVGTHGSKMMFEWTFEFGWFEDLEEEIPLMSGGILAMTKEWWLESGKYDPGMLEWGGENLEQSMRLWMCGGEIVVDRRSEIGHIFSRPPKPNPGNRLVIQVQKNQKRAAKVWLDEYYYLFYKYHPEARPHQEGDITSRRLLRYEHLTCMPFQWYVDKFRPAFERNLLLDHDFKHIEHGNTGLCLTADRRTQGHDRVKLERCDISNRDQHWQVVSGNRMLQNRGVRKCLDAASYKDPSPILYMCDWSGVIRRVNTNQFWQWDASTGIDDVEATGRIFVYDEYWSQSLTGADIFPLQRSHLEGPQAKCLAAEETQGSRGPLVFIRPCPGVQTGREDPMRFIPKWVRAPLSTRFGKRTLNDAEKVTDQAALNYLKSSF
ncbi:polypeptide N-acetylgalactosaminyltransferase 2 [Cyclospora cayetanensis]|nr:polypeptide N-acetylgalactosaminyltransferase 2 [Cyclospora cayetanensis]